MVEGQWKFVLKSVNYVLVSSVSVCIRGVWLSVSCRTNLIGTLVRNECTEIENEV